MVEYITPEYVSKRTGRKVHAAFPEGAKDDVNYDGTVKAAAYLLNNQCCVSINKTRECLVHVESYLRSSIENEPDLEWNRQMLEWIKEAIHYRNSILEGESADGAEIEELVGRYGKILDKAAEEYEYEPPGEYFRDGYNLYLRMSKDREDYLLFLKELSIPPTNNAAENAARKYKRKNAQVMCFRSEEGRDYFCDGLSVMESMKAKGENLYEGVKERFNQVTGTVL